MRKFYLVIISIFLAFLLACDNSSVPDIAEIEELQVQDEYIAEEIKKESIPEMPNEEIQDTTSEEYEEKTTSKEYDYKEDPNTLVVNITDDNIDEYFDLTVCEKTNVEGIDLYYVQTHCLMFDKGYTCVGYENALFNCGYAAYNDTKTGNFLEMDGTFLMDSPFEYDICWFFSKEDADKYSELGIKHFKPHFRSENATLYFQKLSDDSN